MKAGDLVGELPDPNANNQNNDLTALNAAAAGGSKPDRGGGGGIYRAGGPTTIFGGSGWGPFSDGPLNAVRKSLLSRDGVAEENWIWMMANRVNEASEVWAKQRKEALKLIEGVDGLAMGGAILPPSQRSKAWNPAGQESAAQSKKRKVGFVDGTPAVGIYEPHTNTICCEPLCIQLFSLFLLTLSTFLFRSSGYATNHKSMGGRARVIPQASHSKRHQSGKRRMGASLRGYYYGVSELWKRRRDA